MGICQDTLQETSKTKLIVAFVNEVLINRWVEKAVITAFSVLDMIDFIGNTNNWRKNRIFALRKELFEKHEEYSVTKQVSNFLSIAHSNASSS